MLRVVSIADGGSGQGYDLTYDIEGLSWSSVNPGGDETASFTYRKPWSSSLPEIDRGNILRITYGIDVVWLGRIEEASHGGTEAQEIQVTAYGLGARLKDGTMQEIYREPDLSVWGEPSLDRAHQLAGPAQYKIGSVQALQSVDTGTPKLFMRFGEGYWAAPYTPLCEAFFDAQGIPIGGIAYTWERGTNVSGGGAWHWQVVIHDEDAYDLGPTRTETGDLSSVAATGSGSFASETATQAYATLEFWYSSTPAGTDGAEFEFMWPAIAIYGKHGMAGRGVETTAGFYASDIVADVLGRVDGITARTIHEQSFIIQRAVFYEPTTHEAVISEINKYEGLDWGTWGPASPLDDDTVGYFDYTDRDPTTQHWFAVRDQADSLDLHSETASLFDEVQVVYTDVSGATRRVTREQASEILDAAGIPRTLVVTTGVETAAGAAQLGDMILDLQGGFAPARGSVAFSRPVPHYQRGELSPAYMRADGSNIRLPDVLPSRTLFELSATPDRRTTFPIKRVSVSVSDKITAQVDLDQSHDLLSVLQARLGLGVELLGL